MNPKRMLALAIAFSLALMTAAPRTARADFSFKKWAGIAGVAYGVRSLPTALPAAATALEDAGWSLRAVPRRVLLEAGVGMAATIAGATILFWSSEASADEFGWNKCQSYEGNPQRVNFLKTFDDETVLRAAAHCPNLYEMIGDAELDRRAERALAEREALKTGNWSKVEELDGVKQLPASGPGAQSDTQVPGSSVRAAR